MFPSPTMLIVNHYRDNHQRILKFLDRLTDEQLHWQSPSGGHAIAWHVWHLARWADYTAAAMPAMTPELRRLGDDRQIWHTEGLAAGWGFASDQLGYAETGMYMADDIAIRLPFPAKEALLDYLRKAFERVDERVGTLTEAELQSAEQPQPLTDGIWGEGMVVGAIMEHVVHDFRHLGMMEALLGLQGQAGTATS